MNTASENETCKQALGQQRPRSGSLSTRVSFHPLQQALGTCVSRSGHGLTTPLTLFLAYLPLVHCFSADTSTPTSYVRSERCVSPFEALCVHMPDPGRAMLRRLDTPALFVSPCLNLFLRSHDTELTSTGQRFVQFSLWLALDRKPHKSYRPARCLLALVTLQNLRYALAKPSKAATQALLQLVQDLADSFCCLSLWCLFSAGIRDFRQPAEVAASLCALFMSANALWAGARDVQLIQQEIVFRRYELQGTQDADADDQVVSDVSALRQERKEVKLDLIRRACESALACEAPLSRRLLCDEAFG